MKVVIDDCRLERMDVYTDPLNDKIKRQAAEITRLLAENAELKKGREAIRDNAFEAGLIRGQEEAWKLAKKIGCYDCDGGFTEEQREEIFCQKLVPMVFHKHTYTEAAAKVAEWERKKEEICVGDVVECEEPEIVHCKDCKLHNSCSTEDVFNFVRMENGFCAVGSRKQI